MNEEVWKDINGFEGLYEVSNYGRVRTIKTQLIRSPFFHKKKYLKVTLRRKDHKKHYRIHRLVAQAFIPNPDNKAEVNHKDFNKINNHVNNLEWTTQEENTNHYLQSDRYKLYLQTVVK
jgi:hypothetical protein